MTGMATPTGRNPKTTGSMTHDDIISPATRDFILAHREDDVRQLALRHRAADGIDMAMALRQIDGWQRARHKIPTWTADERIIFPPHISMEQCSSEATALYKTRLAGGSEDAVFADLTGGFGVDFSFMSRQFGRAYYVERQEELCRIARHNFRVMGMENAVVVNSTAEEFIQKAGEGGMGAPPDVIYLDPARRDANGRKTYAITDCTPDVVSLMPHLTRLSRRIIIKLSPMLDHREAARQLGGVSEVHIVSTGNECKETLLVIDRDHATAAPTVLCVNDGNIFASPLLSSQAVPVLSDLPEPGMGLYVPNASVMKGGCFSALCERYALAAVGVNSHLFCAKNAHFIDSSLPPFPGRTFIIKSLCSLNRKDVARCLAGIQQANISTRNFPLSADALRKKLRLRDGGDTYIFATTAAGRHVLVVAAKC